MPYLDHAATTPLLPQVLAAMEPWLRDDFGNPSSLHERGRRAARAVHEAREFLRGALGADRVVFTGSGTEANNLAITGAALARTPGRVLCSSVEHASVRAACARLQRLGHAADTFPVGGIGRVDLPALAQRLGPDVRVVAFLYGSNETGTVAPLPEIVECVRRLAPDAHIHVDAVQAFTRIDLDVDRMDLDSAALSAHKFHGPKGVGALALSSTARIEPIVHGGGQEGGLRSGTENVAGIAGLHQAAAIALSERAHVVAHTERLRARLAEGLAQRIDGFTVLGDPTHRLPHILSASIRGIAGEALLLRLDAHGIAISTGAACHEGKDLGNPVLHAMGLSPTAMRGAIRLSVSRLTTVAEVDEAVARIADLVNELRPRAG
jgi:cysteine desulfurase